MDGQEGAGAVGALSGNRLEVNVHVITGAVDLSAEYREGVNRAGLDVVDIILQPLASSEAVLSQEERELGVVMVDLGERTTDLAIFLVGIQVLGSSSDWRTEFDEGSGHWSLDVANRG